MDLLTDCCVDRHHIRQGLREEVLRDLGGRDAGPEAGPAAHKGKPLRECGGDGEHVPAGADGRALQTD